MEIIPRIDVNEISNLGEKKIYQELMNQLPNDWFVRYNFVYTLENNGTFDDGEADFIISAPNYGILFIEVKGSRGYDSKEGKWFRITTKGERVPTKNPFTQVQKSKHIIMKKIKERLGIEETKSFPGVYGHCVIYPFGRIVGNIPSSEEEGTILSYKDMNSLVDRFKNIFLMWKRAGHLYNYNESLHNKVKQFLKNEAKFVIVAAAEMDIDEQQLIELTKRQYDGFQSVIQNKRILVNGPAGSGKTMVAIWSAQYLFSKGENILYLCFNKSLAQFLKLLYPTLAEKIHSFHKYCIDIIDKYSKKAMDRNFDSEEFWEETVPNQLLEISSIIPDYEKLDYIIVDEAQDFKDNWWTAIQLLLKDPDSGGLQLFLDHFQAGVYNKKSGYPTHGATLFELSENCRNTKFITEYCTTATGNKIAPFELSPQGTPPLIKNACKNSQEQAECIRSILANLTTEEISSRSIVFLSPFSWENCSHQLIGRVNQKDIVPLKELNNLEKWFNDEVYLSSTVKSFKGLESSCVIISDISLEFIQNESNKSDLYVAITRAKHKLFLIPNSLDCQKELTAWLS